MTLNGIGAESVPFTKEEAFKLMGERGYQKTAESGDGETKFYFGKMLDNGYRLSAEIDMKRNNVQLHIKLKKFCILGSQWFPIDLKRFNEIEETLINYLGLLDNVVEDSEKVVIVDKPKAEPKTIAQRKDELWQQIRQVGKERGYEKEMCLEFYNYWVEMNPNGKKMRFEMERVFDVVRRLATWKSHDKKWSKPLAKSFADQKAEKQETELKTIKSVVDHEVGRFVDFNIGECNEANKKDYNKVTDATFVITDNGLQCKVDTLVTDIIIRKHLPIDSTKIKVK